MTMTSAAKSTLAKTIRTLRERLLTELNEATDREYRLTVRQPKLDAARLARRKRLEAWLDEQSRGEKGKRARSREDFRREAEQQAAYTLLNRLVILRIMEATGLRKPPVVTDGWNSRGYKDFRELAPALAVQDDSEGYAFLLRLIWEDLAVDLPGLFGPAGIADLIPVPSATIRTVIEALDDPELASCWTDDMTLGWIYQYWNDPRREELDKKINEGGKIEPHEIASKTQMFTERYMVDWLLQNSLGPMWLAICQKNGWTPDVEADGTLARLEARRAQWRSWRDERQAALAAEQARQRQDPSHTFDEDKLPGVSLTALMPLETEAERRWAYFVPQPIPDDALEHTPDSVRDLKILDPAVGSGHFLVVAFDLLLALYEEEARHQEGSPFERKLSVERILEHNLHGIDLDPRAVQIAAATLWLKTRRACPEARPGHMNLVASNLGIASLPDDDPGLVELRRVVEEETGIPAELTNQIVDALRGADHLGSLLKVDTAIEEAIAKYEQQSQWTENVRQLTLFPDGRVESAPRPLSREWATTGILSALEQFLGRHTSAQELGLRLRGEQLAAGVRFVRMMREGSYDLVVANPPYQGTNKLRESKWYERNYRIAKTDLFAGMTVQALSLLRPGGTCAMIAISNWMYLKSFVDFRSFVLTHHLSALADLGKAAFSTGGTLISTACYVIRNLEGEGLRSVAIRPMSPDEVRRDADQPTRMEAALRLHRGRHSFDPAALKVVPEWPLVYWWESSLLTRYASGDLLVNLGTLPIGLQTGDNTRFLRAPWEVAFDSIDFITCFDGQPADSRVWKPYIKGAGGAKWIEPLSTVIRYPRREHAAIDLLKSARYGQGATHYFRAAVAYNTKGSQFSARVHRYPSVFDVEGRSIFDVPIPDTLLLLNSSTARFVAQSLNPTIHFTAGDVGRIPSIAITHANTVFEQIEAAFTIHESHREPSVEFQEPGPSPWRHAQEWAQEAVDRPEGTPLPEYIAQLDPEPPTDHISFAVGVALGRFPLSHQSPHGRFSLRESASSGDQPSTPPTAEGEIGLRATFAERKATMPTLPHGILFIDGTLDKDDLRDSLGHEAATIIHETWDTHGARIDPRRSLRDWLRERFFADVHKGMYENRPIHWPLSSAKKTFVAWVNIHRWTEQTLRVLLADHLQPALTRLEGELADLTAARGAGDKKAVRKAEQRLDDVRGWRDELADVMQAVQQCAERGPAPADPKKPEREVDARYAPDLDDGVMINSAALWPLLDPQWKDPKKWWKELVAAKGKKDYDWSRLAMRYWPDRVDRKCQQDPSLGVAHGCFWKYHPARAWAWELRLQVEIGPEFRIEEASYRGDGGDVEHRAAFLRDHAREALEIIEKEVIRRQRKQKAPQASLRLIEPGLWSSVPDVCWALETRIMAKQEAPFELLAPDEPTARREFMECDPTRANMRRELLERLTGGDMFDGSPSRRDVRD